MFKKKQAPAHKARQKQGPEKELAPAGPGAVGGVDIRTIQQLDETATEVSAKMSADGRFAKAFVMADGMQRLRTLLDSPGVAAVMQSLQDSRLGYMTDHDPRQIDRKTGQPNRPYLWSVVKECLIEATLRGLPPVGNHWNILAGNCYVTKEGMTYLVETYPGLTNVLPSYGVPRTAVRGAVTRCKVGFDFRGKHYDLECDIPVRVNDGQGVDAILGKTQRKLFARVYEHVTLLDKGQAISLPTGDVDDGDGPAERATVSISLADAMPSSAKHTKPDEPQKATAVPPTRPDDKRAIFEGEPPKEESDAEGEAPPDPEPTDDDGGGKDGEPEGNGVGEAGEGDAADDPPDADGGPADVAPPAAATATISKETKESVVADIEKLVSEIDDWSVSDEVFANYKTTEGEVINLQLPALKLVRADLEKALEEEDS